MAIILLGAVFFWVSVWVENTLSAEQCRISAQTDSVTEVQDYIAFACINHSDLTGKNTLHLAETRPQRSVWMRKIIKHSDAERPCEAVKHICPHFPHHCTQKSKNLFQRSLYVFSVSSLFAHMASWGWRMPRLEVAGTNNYDQRNYGAKGTAATSTADKSLWARGDGDWQRVREKQTGKRRRAGACSTIQQLSL